MRDLGWARPGRMLPQCKKGLQLAAQMAMLRHVRLRDRMAVDSTLVVAQEKPAIMAPMLKEP